MLHHIISYSRLAFFGLLAIWSAQLSAQPLQNAQPSSSILQLLNDTPHQFAHVFLDSDSYAGQITLTVAAADVGKLAKLYVAGSYQNQWFIKSPTDWQPWDARLESLISSGTMVLKSNTVIDIFQKQPLIAGRYQIYAAYQIENAPMVVSPSAMEFTVLSAQAESLHRFESAAALESFLKLGMQYSSSNPDYLRRLSTLATTTDSTGASTGSPTVSTTNVQETGVDEADTIKTDGRHLFALRDCGSKTCVVTFALNAGQARAVELGVYNPLSSSSDKIASSAESMYLIQDRPQGEDLIVTLSGQNQYRRWFDIWEWGGNSTRLEFLDATDPARLRLQQSLTLDGSLVSSRRVGDSLYLVTRYTPALRDYIPYANDAATKQANAELLTRKTLSDLIPKATFSNQEALDLIKSERCYLATSAVDASRNPSMITITTVPLGNPAAFESTCYIGNSETMYMTPESLYLATTRSEYNFLTTNAIIYNPEHETAIHKFSLTKSGVDYRGSGKVKGHLGWSEDKRSFRMGTGGEHDEYLNVVTSIGDSWGTSSSTRLTVLKDGADKLQPIRIIDGIGKPGEQLYAARFLGNRAYLVTFRVIDPLYVLDLSDQENPRIAGELEIDGYSDYLHPISDTLLVGIGKDAIPDDSSTDLGFGRGAWYQGVKLSLFDVANPAAPREINSLVFGKRGSDADILRDHHAISFLPATATTAARFAIPIQIHETAPNHAGFDSTRPNAWYSFTRRGLFSFEVSNAGLRQTGTIEADSTTGIVGFPVGSRFGDRSVLLDNTVFYIHNGEVLSSFWGGK